MSTLGEKKLARVARISRSKPSKRRERSTELEELPRFEARERKLKHEHFRTHANELTALPWTSLEPLYPEHPKPAEAP